MWFSAARKLYFMSILRWKVNKRRFLSISIFWNKLTRDNGKHLEYNLFHVTGPFSINKVDNSSCLSHTYRVFYCNMFTKDKFYQTNKQAVTLSQLWMHVFVNYTMQDMGLFCTGKEYIKEPYGRTIGLETKLFFSGSSLDYAFSMEDNIRALKFVACGAGRNSSFEFSGLVNVFQKSVWFWLIVSSGATVYLLSRLTNTCTHLMWAMLFTRIYLGQCHDKPVRSYLWYFLVVPTLFVSIVISNAWKNDNVYNMVAPRQFVPFKTIQELKENRFVVFTESSNFAPTLPNPSDFDTLKLFKHLVNAKGYPAFESEVYNLFKSQSRVARSLAENKTDNFVLENTLLHENTVSLFAYTGYFVMAVWPDIYDWQYKEMFVRQFKPLEELFLNAELMKCNNTGLLVSNLKANKLAMALRKSGARYYRKIHIGQKLYFKQRIGFVLSGFVPVHIIERAKRLFASGVFEWISSSVVETPIDNVNKHEDERVRKKPTMSGNILVIFSVLLGGLSLSTAIFLVSFICSRFKKFILFLFKQTSLGLGPACLYRQSSTDMTINKKELEVLRKEVSDLKAVLKQVKKENKIILYGVPETTEGNRLVHALLQALLPTNKSPQYSWHRITHATTDQKTSSLSRPLVVKFKNWVDRISGVNLQKGISLVTKGTEEDRNKNFEEALRLYDHGVECFLQSIIHKTEKDKANETIRRKCMEYLKRANAIQNYLQGLDDRLQQPCRICKDTRAIQADNNGDISEMCELAANLSKFIKLETGNVKWSDVMGLEIAKQTVRDSLILPIKLPHLFTERKGYGEAILLFGPKGTGKSLLAESIATEATNANFFSAFVPDFVSDSSGKPEHQIEHLFALANKLKPSIVFIDKIDLLCATHSNREAVQKVQRIRAVLLRQVQNNCKDKQQVYVLRATNRPWALDADLFACFQKSIYTTLPEMVDRAIMFEAHLANTPNTLTQEDLNELAMKTERYSGADIQEVIREALLQPLRKVQTATHFRRVRGQSKSDTNKIVDDLLTPCSSGVPGAIKMTWAEIPQDKLLEPRVTLMDLLKSLESVLPTASKNDIYKFKLFSEKVGNNAK